MSTAPNPNFISRHPRGCPSFNSVRDRRTWGRGQLAHHSQLRQPQSQEFSPSFYSIAFLVTTEPPTLSLRHMDLPSSDSRSGVSLLCHWEPSNSVRCTVKDGAIVYLGAQPPSHYFPTNEWLGELLAECPPGGVRSTVVGSGRKEEEKSVASWRP